MSDHHKAKGIRPSPEAIRLSHISKGSGPEHPSWKGGTTVYANGYRGRYRPDHARAHPNGYVYEHILVAERMLGRSLAEGEVVHHINRDKLDNREENLRVFASHSEHIIHHRRNTPRVS